MTKFQQERERIGRQYENGYMTRTEFVREREKINRAEQAEIRRLAALLKEKSA